MTIFAVISGAESWEDIEDFGETHLDFLKQYGDFENGIPVHDTIARVVSCISPAKFHELASLYIRFHGYTINFSFCAAQIVAPGSQIPQIIYRNFQMLPFLPHWFLPVE